MNNKLTVIKGASGRGKTSLMNAMLGLEQPVSGQIWFFGNRVSTKISTGIIDHVAVAPQSAQVISGRNARPAAILLIVLRQSGNHLNLEIKPVQPGHAHGR